MLLLSLFFIIFVCRLLTYLCKWVHCAIVYTKYDMHCDSEMVYRYEAEIESIFRECGGLVTYLHFKIKDKKLIDGFFNKAMGYYEYNIKSNFCPIFWYKKLLKEPFFYLTNGTFVQSLVSIIEIFVLTLCLMSCFFDFASIFSPEILNTIEIVIKMLNYLK